MVRDDPVDHTVTRPGGSEAGRSDARYRRACALYSPPLPPLLLKRPHLHPNYGEDW